MIQFQENVWTDGRMDKQAEGRKDGRTEGQTDHIYRTLQTTTNN